MDLNEIYTYVHKLKELGKSREEVIVELNRLGVDPQYISVVVDNVYLNNNTPLYTSISLHSENPKDEHLDDEREEKTTFLRSFIYFNSILLLIILGIVYTLDRWIGIYWISKVTTTSLIGIDLLLIIIISLVASSQRSYWASLLYAIFSLFIIIGEITLIFYLEFPLLFKSLIIGEVLPPLSRMSNYLSTFLIGNVIGVLLITSITRYLLNKIKIMRITNKLLKNIFLTTFIIVTLAILFTFISVNVLFREDVNLNPVIFSLQSCESSSYHSYSRKIMHFCEIQNSKSSLLDSQPSLQALKKELSRKSINLRNRKERDMYLLMMSIYTPHILKGGEFYLFLTRSLFSNIYLKDPSENIMRDLLSNCPLEGAAITYVFKSVYNSTFYSTSYERGIIASLINKYFLDESRKIIDCLDKHKDKLYIILPLAYPLPLKEAQRNESYWERGLVLRDEDISLLKNILDDLTLINNGVLTNYKKIVGEYKISKFGDKLIEEKEKFQQEGCNITIQNISILLPNKIHFSLGYPILCDKYFRESKEEDLYILVNGKLTISEMNDDYHPHAECIKKEMDKKIRFDCTLSPVNVSTYNIIKISFRFMDVNFVPLKIFS